MNVPKQTLVQHDIDCGLTLAQGLGGLLGTAEETGFAGIYGGGHDAPQALIDPHGGTGHHGVLNGVHLIGDHADGMIDGVLGEELCVVRTGGYGLLQNTPANFS